MISLTHLISSPSADHGMKENRTSFIVTNRFTVLIVKSYLCKKHIQYLSLRGGEWPLGPVSNVGLIPFRDRFLYMDIDKE